jgi:hypothetical protein
VDEIALSDAGPLVSLLGRDLVEARFARGCRCFVVWMGEGEVGGYGWLSTRPEWIGEIHLEIRPRTGEGYIWNCFTVPEHRRKGIFRSLVVGVSNVAFSEGIKRLWIGSVDIPAEKALAPLGFRPVVSISGVTFGGFLWARVKARDAQLAREAEEVLGSGPGFHVRRTRIVRH